MERFYMIYPIPDNLNKIDVSDLEVVKAKTDEEALQFLFEEEIKNRDMCEYLTNMTADGFFGDFLRDDKGKIFYFRNTGLFDVFVRDDIKLKGEELNKYIDKWVKINIYNFFETKEFADEYFKAFQTKEAEFSFEMLIYILKRWNSINPRYEITEIEFERNKKVAYLDI